MYIDIKPTAEKITNNITSRISNLDIQPKLVAVTYKPDDSTISYLKSQQKTSRKFNIKYEIFEAISPQNIFKLLNELSKDNTVHGIFLTHPLPDVNEIEALIQINPDKDVEGRHPYNLGMLAYGNEKFPPCTAEAIIKILEDITNITGKNAVIIGRSTAVGKPLALMLLRKDRSATVTICHTKTQNLENITKNSDIVIAAAGKANLITKNMVKKNSIVIDVGINVVNNKIVGDVSKDTSEIADVTPVPGGVGKITTLLLMEHVVKSVELMLKNSNK
ncbi:bifunctional 5,10-methylenetetrahydrofolate dehydrogenase/5,10-methenyltetrahydrofolate cyclohydrolase [Thermosipho atlanticus]|uniref:Bifunctional protein FolD n=1 Tax=Thermosipho atlanticus DSM 15807 TaxID=1123380 RepID=A0A1M5SGS8_9BACT|nr:bifunctional 5,10-methylenetetrahydrofolate dehydrogenase/5,10-methenyltetrahydrofolate cyclohydrolase [Thermosipho atlanticus]SHH37744.1 methenyltetrahydrofolate cyclohydrolase [Thermosipho atlanticus DSM 15807]